jgi:hypothetical protein
VPQGVLQQSRCGKEELSEKLSEVFLSQCILKNAIYIFMKWQEFIYCFLRQMDAKHASLVKSIANFVVFYCLVQLYVPMQEILVYF